jgi:hypothetical protein
MPRPQGSRCRQLHGNTTHCAKPARNAAAKGSMRLKRKNATSDGGVLASLAAELSPSSGPYNDAVQSASCVRGIPVFRASVWSKASTFNRRKCRNKPRPDHKN